MNAQPLGHLVLIKVKLLARDQQLLPKLSSEFVLPVISET